MGKHSNIETQQPPMLGVIGKLYLNEADNRIETDTHLLEQYLQGRISVG
jgi:hypothetical protein